ncbi:hypothetical protein JOF41_003399 [Saccharothrix coeruleofusca]|uniref:hypothetical protein n=1 Tax=Saccharothrix coeruleofusca TaxID=33919 RepID=UPI001AE56F05|nr:hypothetical protein [Saccharothrix coeruleofusca]MBP2337221.1 hypothetical protein [Saccharothrix coeruleofusca]
MSNFSAKQAKSLLLWLHVISSVGWIAMAVVQLTLLTSVLNGPPDDRLLLLETALKLEDGILDPFGITAAYTGVMLSALTPWGFFRHWWVTVKFWLTLIAILLGSIFLGRWLEGSIEALRAGHDWSPAPLYLGTGWTLGTLLLMVWLSIAKPWGRRGAPETRQERAAVKRVEQSQGTWLFVAAMAIPVVEYLSGMDYPLLTFCTGVGFSVYRSRRLRRVRRELAAEAAGRTAPVGSGAESAS